MYEQLEVHYEGQTEFVATEQESKPLRLFVTCPAGLEAGADVRVSISTFHSYSRKWTLADPFVEGGEGVVVLGHGLASDWTDMTRGGDGPAGGGLVGRPLNELYLCTIQVTKSLSAGARLVFPFGVVPSPYADISGALQVRVRRPEAEVFEKVGEPIPLSNAPGPLTRLEGRVSATADAEGKRRAVVFATDDHLNPIPDYRGTVNLQADGAVGGLPDEVEVGADGRGVVEGIAVQADSPVRITARDVERGLAAQSGPTQAGDERGHYFGGIHFHTQLSVDGDREPRAAYAYARDFLNLDVIAMTDHAPIGPGWAECLAVNEEFYEPGRFVTIPRGKAPMPTGTPTSICGRRRSMAALGTGNRSFAPRKWFGTRTWSWCRTIPTADSLLNTASTARSWARRFTGRNTIGNSPTSGLGWWKSSRAGAILKPTRSTTIGVFA